MFQAKLSKNIAQLVENKLKTKPLSVIDRCIIVLEDLYSILSEEIDEVSYEEKVDSQTILNLEDVAGKCFELASQIIKDNIKPSFLTFFKDMLLQREKQLAESLALLLEGILQVKVELKQLNFAITFSDIVNQRARGKDNKKKASSLLDNDIYQQYQSICRSLLPSNQIFDLQQVPGLSTGQLLDKQNSNSLNNIVQQKESYQEDISQVIVIDDEQNGSNKVNNYINQEKSDEVAGSSADQTQRCELVPQFIKLFDSGQLEFEVNKQDLKQDDNGDLAKSLRVFQRENFKEMFQECQNDLARISRNHATLSVKLLKGSNQFQYFLVNHSENGCSVQQKSLNDSNWVRIKKNNEMEIRHNDMIGILFKGLNANSELLIGYKFIVTSN